MLKPKLKKPRPAPVYILSDQEIDDLGKAYLLEPEELRGRVDFETWLRCRHVPATYDDDAVESPAHVRVDRVHLCELLAVAAKTGSSVITLD